MVQPQLQKPAIKAIESLISVARFRALQGCDSNTLAEMLDGISYLPQLLLDEQERTSDFVKSLRQIAEDAPESQMALREFEAHLSR